MTEIRNIGPACGEAGAPTAVLTSVTRPGPGARNESGPVLPAGSTLAPNGLNNWVNPHVNSWNQVDLNVTRNFNMAGTDMAAYFVVQNALNAQPMYVPNGTIGQWYPVYTSGYSIQSPMGRTFTIGLRANL